MIGILTVAAITILALRKKRSVSGIGALSRLEWSIYRDLIHRIEEEILDYIESNDYDPELIEDIAPLDQPRLDISVSPNSRTGYDFEVIIDEAKYFLYPEKTYDIETLITEHEDGYLTIDYEELENLVMDFLDRQLGKDVAGIGAAQRVKRRIYKEIAAAQKLGVDFDLKYQDLMNSQLNSLEEVGKMFGWKQAKRSIESGKPYTEAYYNSLKRAYNAIAGVGIGAADYDTYTIRNGNGKIILQWREYAPVVEHLQQEPVVEIVEQATVPTKLTQQEKILQVWPYLKVWHNGKVIAPTDEQLPPFTHVAWRKMLNRDGEVLAEGAMMAFVTEKEANDWVDTMRKQVKKRDDYWPTRLSVKAIKNVKPELYL